MVNHAPPFGVLFYESQPVYTVNGRIPPTTFSVGYGYAAVNSRRSEDGLSLWDYCSSRY